MDYGMKKLAKKRAMRDEVTADEPEVEEFSDRKSVKNYEKMRPQIKQARQARSNEEERLRNAEGIDRYAHMPKDESSWNNEVNPNAEYLKQNKKFSMMKNLLGHFDAMDKD